MELKKNVPLNRGGFKRLWSRAVAKDLSRSQHRGSYYFGSYIKSPADSVKSPSFRNSAILIITVCHRVSSFSLSLPAIVSVPPRTAPKGNINPQNRIKANDLPTESLYYLHLFRWDFLFFFYIIHTNFLVLFFNILNRLEFYSLFLIRVYLKWCIIFIFRENINIYLSIKSWCSQNLEKIVFKTHHINFCLCCVEFKIYLNYIKLLYSSWFIMCGKITIYII